MKLTAIDQINLSLSAHLGGDIPQKVWIGKDVLYAHLKVFGYKAFVHIPSEEYPRLDSKTKPYIFLSYAHEDYKDKL